MDSFETMTGRNVDQDAPGLRRTAHWVLGLSVFSGYGLKSITCPALPESSSVEIVYDEQSRDRTGGGNGNVRGAFEDSL